MDDPRSAQRKLQTADAYRAVGRITVTFSLIFWWMRRLTADAVLDFDRARAIEVALGTLTAQQLADAFFSVCNDIGKLDEDELKILRKIRKDVRAALEFRNDVAHGDWWVGIAGEGAPEINPSELVRLKPGKLGESHVTTLHTTAQLDAIADGFERLRTLVAEFGMLALQTFLYQPVPGFYERGERPERVSHVLVLRDGEVVREGPRASSSFSA